MKFNFRIQDYQTDAVNAVVECFSGQPYMSGLSYRRDFGRVPSDLYTQLTMDVSSDGAVSETGVKNAKVMLSPSDLLTNIRSVQQKNDVMVSQSLIGDLGCCSLDVEMETGTGKTYVYIKTMYELNEKYGWSKFIVVVPSIAIREGVKKSFEMTMDHFMEHYQKKIRFFVYDSKNLNHLDSFSGDPGINVMIINMQAFNTSLKEGGRGKDSRIIYSKRDEFGSRRPIDVIKANSPILILDEPQKMGGRATQAALKNFNPLFTLNYSATHAKRHNLVFALDAVDAYTQKLVKKIEVKGFEVKNFRGSDAYMYLEEIIVSPKEAPKVRLEFEIGYKKSINRESRILSVDDNLYELSKHMEQYRTFRIADIDAYSGTVTFTNGQTLSTGQVSGDTSEDDIRRVQILETIKSHLQKEEELFNQGIKTLSLFFIDEVAKYRKYDEEGNDVLGEYGKIFEREYNKTVKQYIAEKDTPYRRYLAAIPVTETHTGYFSIDKKGRSVNSTVKRGSDISDDISAYELILKNKERLLSFDEPTRFIFSHSALREGWDNPNVFQICTLKQGNSTTMKRQEVGRGLRLCVDRNGFRMDAKALGMQGVHSINKLTVIASESYKNFVTDLQKEIKDDLYDRPTKANPEYFEGKTVLKDGVAHKIIRNEAVAIYKYLLVNGYVGMGESDSITSKYHEDLEAGSLAPMTEELSGMEEGIHLLIQSIYSEGVLKEMVANGLNTKVQDNDLNENFYKKEFQQLWSAINHKYAYTVTFDSDELIKKAVHAIDEGLYVSKLLYTITVSEQIDELTADRVREGRSFKEAQSSTKILDHYGTSSIKYDLVGKITEATVLTRKTVVAILKRISPVKFAMYKDNPEEFITKISHLINEQKAAMVVEHISYDELDEEYDSTIFTAEKQSTIDRAFPAKKHIQPYVFTDGTAEKSVERQFAEDLDGAAEVSVFAKLPRGFSIPTPVGNYSPDWAIAFKAGTVKHIFFIAETKGSMQSMQLRPIEKAKISCAKKLFNEISTEDIVYHDVDSYQSLLSIMESIE